MSLAQERRATAGAINGGSELALELDRLSASSRIAAEAPRSKGLATYLSRGMAAEPLDGPAGEFTLLTESLLQTLTIWWAPQGYARLPTMVPWCIRDRSARYDQGPESWGAPRDDGYLRDDNSIIKKLPLPLFVGAPLGHPYEGRKLHRGFTACHIWRELPNGIIAGTDPWLYSFMPNLVWMPSPLSPLSDMHESHVQRALQRTSLSLFRDASYAPSVKPYMDHAWSQLTPPPESERTLEPNSLAIFEVNDAFLSRRISYIESFLRGADEVLETGVLRRKLVSSRYSAGLLLLERKAVEKFRDEMSVYLDAVVSASAE